MTMTLTPLLSHKETAKILNVAEQTLYNWRHRRIGPDYIKIGSKPMYRPEDIEKYMESHRISLLDSYR
jgi:predicted DNA-binding transcriptional regulator AlpA